MLPELEPSWKALLSKELDEGYMLNLQERLKAEKAVVYPDNKDIFNAFWKTPLDDVKVVILGQDPYHGAGQAHGLAFSVPEGVPPPPSLKNILRELKNDLGIIVSKGGCLTTWAERGVLLLNTSLTVKAGEAGSHHKWGWEIFTNEVISLISRHKKNVVFLMWGKHAQRKASLIDTTKHDILRASHPSPFSAYQGFFGCKHFSLTNQKLKTNGIKPINWRIQ